MIRVLLLKVELLVLAASVAAMGMHHGPPWGVPGSKASAGAIVTLGPPSGVCGGLCAVGGVLPDILFLSDAAGRYIWSLVSSGSMVS